jgi:hypothetical protein
LGVRTERPSDRGTTNKRDEFASLHGLFLPAAEDHTLAHHRERKLFAITAKITADFQVGALSVQPVQQLLALKGIDHGAAIHVPLPRY